MSESVVDEGNPIHVIMDDDVMQCLSFPLVLHPPYSPSRVLLLLSLLLVLQILQVAAHYR
jgi:hypothetical protein